MDVSSFVRYHVTVGANNCTFCSQLCFLFSLLVTACYHIRPWLVQFLITSKLCLLDNSVQMPSGQPKLSLSEAELTSRVGSIPPSPSPVESFFGLVFKLAATGIQFEISRLVFKAVHVPTVAFLFPSSLLVPGPWPLPQTPYIFTPVFFASAIPLPEVFFLFHLKCKVLFKYYFHHEDFIYSL